jgi:aminoglycoside phosphotransferase (APT) family kinase protein
MTETPVDEAGWAQFKEQARELDEVRQGLQDWLRAKLRQPGLSVGPLSTPGGTGVANETLLFDVEQQDGAVNGYVARLATADPLYLDYDLSTHYRMYAEMTRAPSVPTPDVVGYEADSGRVGAPFFVMTRIAGAIPTDAPSWGAEGFVVDASPRQRRHLWERTVAMLAALHQLDSEPFLFLRTHASDDGVGDCLDYWIRSLRWANPEQPVSLTEEAEEWLLANKPSGTALSWGDSRLPNVIYQDYTPVGLLDWDLVSLAGPQADLAWWIIMTPRESLHLDGIGSHDEFIDLWQDITGGSAAQLHWYLVFGAYRLAAIIAKLLAMFVAQGRMPSDMANEQLRVGLHVQLLSGLLDLAPPTGVTPVVPEVRLSRQ